MTAYSDTPSFMADARHAGDDRACDLPEAPMAMPDQDLSHVRIVPGWRLMRAPQPVRN